MLSAACGVGRITNTSSVAFATIMANAEGLIPRIKGSGYGKTLSALATYGWLPSVGEVEKPELRELNSGKHPNG